MMMNAKLFRLFISCKINNNSYNGTINTNAIVMLFQQRTWKPLHRCLREQQYATSSRLAARRKGMAAEVHSVLAVEGNTTPIIDNIDQQLAKLDSLLGNLNVKIAEQQEQLHLEEKEMEKQFGVKLPAKYRAIIGSVDPDCPPSDSVCVGCGAQIHCCSPHEPGFVSSNKFHAMDKLQIQNCVCLRCKGLKSHDVLLDTKVTAKEYRRIISSVRKERSLVLHVLDITDYENSTISDLLDIVGYGHPVYVVANKVDLLPSDGMGYLKHVQKCLEVHSKQCFGKNVKDVSLVSALTGYGVESLVTKLLKHASEHRGHFHLVGCTNSGKSTLFNSLLMSDLCKATARDQIARATTSIWPGTTMNLLKFPVQRMRAHMLAVRRERLREMAAADPPEYKHRSIETATLRGKVEPTLAPAEDMPLEQLKNLPFNVNFKDIHSHYSTSSWDNSVLEPKLKNEPHFDYKEYSHSKWFHDTPGLVNKQQIMNYMNMGDLHKLLWTKMPLPRTFSLRGGMTLFVGGVGRLDVLETTRSHVVLLTVIASSRLPVNVVDTQKADDFYHESLNADQLKVPNTGSDLEKLPELEGKVMHVDGVGYNESRYDIQLSSAGWVSVTYTHLQPVPIKAYTPGGLGCHLRPSMLPYAVQRRGKRLRGSRAFSLKKPLVSH